MNSSLIMLGLIVEAFAFVLVTTRARGGRYASERFRDLKWRGLEKTSSWWSRFTFLPAGFLVIVGIVFIIEGFVS